MQSKPEEYYIDRLNELPDSVKQILENIRTIDLEVLNLQMNIEHMRQELLQNLMEYEKKKTIQKYIEKEKCMKTQKLMIKRKKKDFFKKQRQKNYSLQTLEIKIGGSSKISFNQQYNPKKKKQLAKLYKAIDVMQGKLLYFSKQKMQLSENLYNLVHGTTQEIQNDMLTQIQDQKQPQNVSSKPRKRKDKKQEYIQSQPKYCYCSRPSFGLMVECCNQDCQISWFHSECIGENRNINQQWYCKDCCNYFIKQRKN